MTTEEFELPLAEVNLPAVSKAILVVAAGFTVLWLIGAILLAFAPVPLNTEPLGINEWGDFVAGVSAPIAFIWLVVAVSLQSIELREQRKELALTRAEFKANRAVMVAQADEARRQAEFIEQQTKLLVDEKTDRNAQSVFDASIELISTRLRQYQTAWHVIVVTKTDEEGPSGKELVLRNGNIPDSDQRFTIARSVQAVRTEIRKLRDKYADNEMHAKFPYDFNRLYIGVITGMNRISSLPDSFKIRSDTLELDELREQLIYIAQRTGTKPFDNISSEDII
ncbi:MULTISPECIES: hypothetical protein [Rhizobium/Agrobacterium group]|uniref:hypothetical protein n=1 Tax=Rhizobium/Agrobacterium group TaxID=227290 RepID=UPI000B4006D8|nr:MULTISPECIES: hypothetical protein [Rhizobium/Agrobacterium group]MCF1482468.1 hypothetical protein [Allorhizobium ampelinum]NSZ43891.1 hypothetical protein [Agrobacterium vitis]NTA27639.1 hypothetical protein [Allorhizobium ampelinum]OVE93992.1 hypothetical protein B7W85_14170 [Allorhizobium ampelinum]